ncbi:MAG: ATP-dependent sacrificial sulfur transferase LarE, partial [Phycisphaerales bacterium]
RAVACIATSPSYPKREQQQAIELAEQFGIRYHIVETMEHLDPRYVVNEPDRCYFCKLELHEKVHEVAAEEGCAVIADGNNASDVGDDRPGMAAGRERGVRSPLIEAGINKEQVREIARHLGLPVWDKPAMACLASRVPYGTAVQPELLARIEKAEDVLAGLGFRQFRVRHHGDVARIELPAEDLPSAVAVRERITGPILELGYRFVALDLAGFRSGSLSAASAANAARSEKNGSP